jgi:hypothetical protein
MKESREVEVKPTEPKDSKDTTTSTSINLTERPLATQPQSEILEIKPKIQQSKFEALLINAFKKLVGFNEPKQDKKSPLNTEAETQKVNLCEEELRKALEEISKAPNAFVNKNIIDKCSRINKKNKINLSLLIGHIFIEFMNKKNIFNRINQKNSIDKNIIISFINEVINMNTLLKKTYLGIKYENTLFNFLENIIKEIAFDSEQLNEINVVLQEHKSKANENKLKTENIKDFLTSLNMVFNKQHSLFGQYKVILDNKEEILNLIEKANINDSNEVHDFYELGILLIKLFFGKNCILLNDKNNKDENNEDNKNTVKKLFDGFEDNSHGNVNLILGEKFYVDYDSDIELMREQLCEVILKFVDKFKNVTNYLEFQYIHFVLLKRIYFYFFEKFEKELNPIFVQVLINLCLSKETEKISQVVQFVNELLNSKCDKDENLKELLAKRMEEVKSNSEFNFQPKNKIQGNLEKIKNEIVYVEETNLNLGFFTDVEIESGETFDLYVEISKPFGFLDFAVVLRGYDINFSVTNLTEGKVIYKEKKLKADKTPLKLNLFFTKPGIFKFELDNSYSWVRNKNISYKINTFYPQCPFVFENKVAISKYQELMNNTKKISGKKREGENKLEVIQDQLAYYYDIDDIKDNIELLNGMIANFQVKILSLYLNKEKEEGKEEEKKYFYFEKGGENEKLEKCELTKENLNTFIKENKNKDGTTIVNLFIIEGDSGVTLSPRELSLEGGLGFAPEIDPNEKNPILYFIQYLNQAQLLYYLCNKTEDQQNSMLINYTKFGGYQICLYCNGELIYEIEELKKINKNELSGQNIECICNVIKKMGQEKKIKILVTDSIDKEEKELTSEKMSEALQKSLGINGEEEANYKIIKLNKEYNKEVERNTHLLNLIE